jgi:hypothetical protein
LDFHTFSGVRSTLGSWLDSERTVGMEVSGVLLERRSVSFAAGSDALGNPPLYVPVINGATGALGSFTVADPLFGFTGSVGVTATTRFWGSELNGVFALGDDETRQTALLVGFRYVELDETLRLDNVTTDVLFAKTTTLEDRFRGRNQFYGGQLGARTGWARERWSLGLTGKLGLGVNHQTVVAAGSVTDAGPARFSRGLSPAAYSRRLPTWGAVRPTSLRWSQKSMSALATRCVRESKRLSATTFCIGTKWCVPATNWIRA